MLTADVRFEGWTPIDWSRFLSLWNVVSVGGGHGGLIVVHDEGRVRKVLHTAAGRVDPASVEWPRPLPDVVKAHGASWGWALQAGALEELMERWGARVRRGDDVLTQALLLFDAFRELLDEGAIESWPRRLKNVPLPTRAVIDRAIDALVPAGRCALIALYDRDRGERDAHDSPTQLWTACALRRSAIASPARFDVIAGPSELRREMGLVSGDFRRDYRHLVDAVEAIYGPVAVGLHAEVGDFRRLVTEARPGDWARAVAMRDVVVRPLPSVLALPLGVDATRGAFGVASRVAKRLDPTGVVQPAMRALAALLPDPPATRAAPGFDPLEVLRRLLHR